MSGYDLKTRCFGGSAGHIWPADQAQVYRTLDRLVDRSLVRVKLIAQRGKPDRKLYSIAPTGRAALHEWLARPHALPPDRDPFLIQLFFAGELPDGAILSLLSEARSAYQERLEQLRTRGIGSLEAWNTSPERERDAALRRMTLVARMQAYRAAIDWVDDCIEVVKTGIPPLQTALDLSASGLEGA